MRHLPALIASVALVFHAAFYRATWTDDAFITFRYARRFAAGDGMTFNDGERVEGITNLGWALLLAAFGDGDLFGVARALGLAAAVATVWVLAAWGRDAGLGALARCLSLAALIVPAWVPTWSVQGLETTGVMLLTTVGWTRYVAEARCPGGPPVAGLALGLAPWLRPDAALVPAVLGAWHLWAGRLTRRVWLTVAVVLGCGAALVALKWMWFGQVLPNTVEKLGRWPPTHGLAYARSFFTTPSALLPAAIGLASLRALGWVRSRDPRAVPALLFGAALGAAVVQNGDFMANYRFLVPAWPAAAAAIGLAVQAFAWPRVASVVVAASLIAPGRTFWIDELNQVGQRTHAPMYPASKWSPIPKPDTGLVSKLMFPTAWTLVHAGPGERVAWHEIGLFAYVLDGPALDLLGLTDPAMLADRKTAWEHVSRTAEWLVVSVAGGAWSTWRSSLAKDGWRVTAVCHPAWVFQNPAKRVAPPSPAEVEARVLRALERAPHSRGLHVAIARELADTGASVDRFADAAAHASGHPEDAASVRCAAGVGAGCPPRENCGPGGWRPDVATLANPEGWPQAGDAPMEARDILEETPCQRARRVAFAAWQAAGEALPREPGTREVRRLARAAATAAAEGGGTAAAAEALVQWPRAGEPALRAMAATSDAERTCTATPGRPVAAP